LASLKRITFSRANGSSSYFISSKEKEEEIADEIKRSCAAAAATRSLFPGLLLVLRHNNIRSVPF
jgi:hypothetical protein